MTQIREIMSRGVDLVDPDTTIEEAARRMLDDDVGVLPVGDNDRLVGVITDRDIVVRAVASGLDTHSSKVSQAMSDKVFYCYEDQPLDDVLKNMGHLQVRRLPVVNQEKRLVGMISIGDLSLDAPAEQVGKALHAIST